MSSTPFTASVRIGDAEREAAVAALNKHFAEGRLTSVEHDERTTIALAARTRADLDALFADLPRIEDANSNRAPRSSIGNGGTLPRLAWRIAPALFAVGAVFLFLHVLPFFALLALALVMSRIVMSRVGFGRGRGLRGHSFGPCAHRDSFSAPRW
jgi:hypothetical protein